MCKSDFLALKTLLGEPIFGKPFLRVMSAYVAGLALALPTGEVGDLDKHKDADEGLNLAGAKPKLGWR